jgi:hypothetical protein
VCGVREQLEARNRSYQGTHDAWTIGIWLASRECYTEAELPKTVGPTTGIPEQGVNHTFFLYAGPRANR